MSLLNACIFRYRFGGGGRLLSLTFAAPPGVAALSGAVNLDTCQSCTFAFLCAALTAAARRKPSLSQTTWYFPLLYWDLS